MTLGYIIIAAVIAALCWMAYRFIRMPKRTCIYPHCSPSRDRCLPHCPHFRNEKPDEFDGGYGHYWECE